MVTPYDRFSKDNLIDELLKLKPDVLVHDRYLQQIKKATEELRTGRGAAWYKERDTIVEYTEFIRAIQWFLGNLHRPAGLRDWDVPKVRRYVEHMISKGALPERALEVLNQR